MSIQRESTHGGSALHELMVARSRVEVAELQYKRHLKKLRRTPDKLVSQSVVARRLHISQPALSKALKGSEDIADVPEGFSGASPREICQLYAIGELSREQLIDELSRWPYPAPVTLDDAWDALSFSPPGSWDEVERAADDGLIDDDLLDDVIDALPEDD
ncbi:helix-turn-helix domain-containing protein [Brachybacterium sp. DNPG3]